MKPNTVLGGVNKEAAADITRGKDGTDSPFPESAERYRFNRLPATKTTSAQNSM